MQPDPQTQNPPARAGSGKAKERSSLGANGSAGVLQPPSVDMILSRLEKVRPSGKGFTARCPAHEDRTASLSVTQGADGRLLIHCFASCPTADVLGAVGLSVGDLFPKRIGDATPDQRRELQGHALRAKLRACADVVDLEARVILIAAGDLERGKPLDNADHDRLAVACDRIRAARVAIAGRT